MRLYASSAPDSRSRADAAAGTEGKRETRSCECMQPRAIIIARSCQLWEWSPALGRHLQCILSHRKPAPPMAVVFPDASCKPLVVPAFLASDGTNTLTFAAGAKEPATLLVRVIVCRWCGHRRAVLAIDSTADLADVMAAHIGRDFGSEVVLVD